MAIIVFQHWPTGGPGRFAATFRDHAFRLDVRRLDLPAEGANRHVPGDFDDVEGVVVLGGPQNVGEPHPWMQAEVEFVREAHARQLPLLGICLGHQIIAHALGGEVGPMAKPEAGFVRVQQVPAGNTDTILAGIPWGTWQLQMHGQEVKTLPPDATLLASSAGCRVQCFRAGVRTYGFQWHPECDRPMVDALFTASAKDLAAAGVTPDAARAQADEHYETYGRVSNRLAVNIATYMFPTRLRMRI